uniref:TMEM181 GOLD domain-containing protein n=1 Tax=Phlebotomus papatasi TaxID=29031 RepID=A0A1B0DDC7_PHLPP
MVFMAFFACFGLGIFIGLAGPPITTTTEITATSILPNASAMENKLIMATGPFSMRSPLMTMYAQQLWLIAQIFTDNRDDEAYDKSFQVSLSIDGLTADHKPVPILYGESVKNRTRHLVCERNTCEEFTVLHLGFLDYAHYILMEAKAMDSMGLGYSYHLPSGGFFQRVRNTLSLAQFSDLFSEFNEYIAPAYHHDRCERSVHMRLYSMNKLKTFNPNT